MPMTLDERLRLAKEAGLLEDAGSLWHAKHVAAVLGCSVKTVYDTPWLRQCMRRVRSLRRWHPRELREAQLAESKRRNLTAIPRPRRRTA